MSVDVSHERPDAELDALAAAVESAACVADDAGRPSLEAVGALRASGLLAAAIPRAYGGLGLDAHALNRLLERMAHIDASLAIILFQHFAVASRIAQWGNTEQKTGMLPRLTTGEWLAASAWSETGAGADKRRLATTARRAPTGGWIIDGAKTFVTGAGLADVYLVLGATSEANDTASTYGRAGQSFFLVEAQGPGVLCDTKLDLVGMRGSATGFVSFVGCRAPDRALLGPLDEATRVIASVREHGVTLGAVSVGIAQRAFDVTYNHAARRDLLAHQAVRHRLVDLRTQIEAARALVACAGRCDSQEPGMTTLHSKLFASATSELVVAECQRLLGSAGFVRDHLINRLARDARAVGLMGPTNDLCRELVGAAWPN
ncbi:MAG TPA: acyl-CoA dehydrogenase family protein [Solirubrobacteraceae bacterium]